MSNSIDNLFIGVRKIAALGIVCMLLFAVVSCENAKEPYDEPNGCDKIEQCNCTEQFTELKGTTWKLVGIVNPTTGAIRELEPKHCVECYTLTFETDRIAHVRGVEFAWVLDLCNLPTSPVILPDILICERFGENYYCDSNHFRGAIQGVMSYSTTCKDIQKLKLFNYHRGNPAEGVVQYLLFKRIEL